MKLIRYLDAGGRRSFAVRQADGAARAIAGDPFGSFDVTDEPVHAEALLAPVQPTDIICIGLNYRHHAEEAGLPVPEYPVVFYKGTNAVQHPGAPILLPTALRSDQVDYECELAVVIGRACKNVRREDALDYVLGYTCANDVSARDWQIQRGGSQWCRGKSFDTFCPLGPCLVTPEELPDPNALRIRTILNGAVVQDSNTADMIFDVPELIAFLSGSTTLRAGAVILTGTPYGVGLGRTPPRWLQPGDEVTIDIEGIGALTNPVASEQA
jgi:2-keto-4-pentenoate hydratase/2-oxohepta-3-ene-1,7-dioic acid hydratase in catechol pathway